MTDDPQADIDKLAEEAQRALEKQKAMDDLLKKSSDEMKSM